MSNHVSNASRGELNPRQLDTLDKLLDAARVELDEVGHDALTIRTVAARAGVTPATAYNYFTSRDHLLAELFWRHLATAEPPRLTGRSSTRRLQAILRAIDPHFDVEVPVRPSGGPSRWSSAPSPPTSAARWR